MTQDAISESVASVLAGCETLLYGIEDELSPIETRLLAHIESRLDELDTAFAPILMRIFEAVDINLPGEDGGRLDWSAVERLLIHSSDAIADQEYHIDSVTQRVTTHIESEIGTMSLGIGDLISGLLSSLNDLIGGLLGDLAVAPELWQALVSVMTQAVQEHETELQQFGRDFLSGFMEPGAAVKFAPTIVDGFLDIFRPHAADDNNLTVEALIQQWDNQPAWFRGIIRGTLMVLTAHAQVGAMSVGYMAKLAQRSLAAETPTPLSHSELVNLLRREFITDDWAKEQARRTGLSPQLFDVVYKLTEAHLTTGEYVEMWRRTGDDGQLDTLRKLGIGSDDLERLKLLSQAVPTPTDLVRFMVRDVFDPGAVATGKLDDEFSQKVDPDWARITGVSLDTLKLFWMAHWSLPSPTMFYEMFHRGFITQAEMENALKLADYAPGWIQHLIDINYLVPGRIDVRRMFEAGIITDHAELVKRHTDMGYSPSDAEVIAGFVEKVAAQKASTEAERLHGPLAKEIIRLYSDGAQDYQTSLDQLIALGYTPDEATYRLQVGIFERQRERSEKISAAIRREYVKGFLDNDTARSRLSGYGFGDAEISNLLETWALDQELAEESAEKRHQRDLSKAEIIAAYRDRLVTRDSAVADLQVLGYDADESETLVRLEDARQQREDTKAVESAVHAQYVNRAVDAASAEQTLAGFGYTTERIAALLSRWSIERSNKEPNLSTSQLERIILKGVVPIDQIEPELERRGYSDQERSWLLTLWRSEVATNDATLQERIREFDIREERLRIGQDTRLGQSNRSLDIRESQFAVQQQGIQQRFDATITQQTELQQARLSASAAAQNARIAAQTERDAAAFQGRRELQERQLQASSDRLQAQIDAANARADAAIAERDRARADAAQSRRDAQAATDARQSRALQATAERQERALAAADARAASARQAATDLAAQHAAAARELTDIRAHIQEARDIRANADRIAADARAELVRVRAETRATARKTIDTAGSAANAAALQSLQLQQTAAVADITSRFATLTSQLADQRRQMALDAQLRAQADLARSTPPSAFLDSSS